jgi:hypothetical protein
MLRRRKKTIDLTEIDLNELKELSDASLAKAWVNLLFLHICKDSGNSLTLQKSKGIPPIPLEEEVPPGELDFDRIINRFKVMAGLDPVIYREPRKGKISLRIHGTWYCLNATFIDSVADSQCEITVHKGEPQ